MEKLNIHLIIILMAMDLDVLSPVLSTILGVIVQSNLRLESQIQQIVSKSTKAVWTIRRMKALGVGASSPRVPGPTTAL